MGCESVMDVSGSSWSVNSADRMGSYASVYDGSSAVEALRLDLPTECIPDCHWCQSAKVCLT